MTEPERALLRLPDLWWLKPRGRRCAYVCPLLMTLSMWICRARGRSARWWLCRYSDGSACARALLRDSGEIGCFFPHGLIERECDFWNSRPGLRIRSR